MFWYSHDVVVLSSSKLLTDVSNKLTADRIQSQGLLNPEDECSTSFEILATAEDICIVGDFVGERTTSLLHSE